MCDREILCRNSKKFYKYFFIILSKSHVLSHLISQSLIPFFNHSCCFNVVGLTICLNEHILSRLLYNHKHAVLCPVVVVVFNVLSRKQEITEVFVVSV